MSLENIPIDVFFKFLPYLEVPDILSLSIVSKEMETLTKDNLVWREMFIQKKKDEFHEKETSIARKFVFNRFKFVSFQPIHVYLVIQNTSDIIFNISHVTGRFNYEKKYGKVLPYDTNIIRTYINHRWLIIPRERTKGKKTNEVYESKGFIIKHEDISPYPMEFKQNNGEKKLYRNVVIVPVGNPYNSETAQKVVHKSLPQNPRNYKNFKKMTLRSYVPRINNSIVRSKKTIHHNELSLLENKDKLAKLQLIIERQEMKVVGEKDYVEKMERFVNLVKNM